MVPGTPGSRDGNGLVCSAPLQPRSGHSRAEGAVGWTNPGWGGPVSSAAFKRQQLVTVTGEA